MYLLLAVSILFASLGSILLHRLKLPSAAAVYRLNLVTALVWLTLLLALNGFTLTLSRTVLLFGLIYGVTQALFILFKSLAMNRGSPSVTSLLGNGSLLLSVAVSYLAFDEAVTVWDLLGLFLLLVAIFLTADPRHAPHVPPKRGWLPATLLFMILGAGVGISFKAFGRFGDADAAGDMMCVAAAVMALVLLPLYLAARREDRRRARPAARLPLALAVASGLLSCGYNRLNITLSGALDAIVFFPFFNGGVIILTTICSVLFTKERLRAGQILGLVLGVAAIAVIGIF